MDRTDSIEKYILSRCSRYHDDGEILKVLEDRYSLTGPQKNFLILESTTGGYHLIDHQKMKKKKKGKRNIFKELDDPTSEPVQKRKRNKFDALKTKNQFKKFIKTNMKAQKKAVRELKRRVKSNPHYLDKVHDCAGLKICDHILKIEDFDQLHRLWNNYARESLGITNNILAMTTRLSTCEFIGAYMEISHSGNPNNVGMRGIVIWESQHNFIMVVPRTNNWKASIGILKPNFSYSEMIGGIRIINKYDTRFKLEIGMEDDTFIEFEIIGDRFMVRSIDRANKKFKNHAVRDIKL